MFITLFEIPDNLIDSELAIMQLSDILDLEKGSLEWVDAMSLPFEVKHICYDDKVSDFNSFKNVLNTYHFWGKKLPPSLYFYVTENRDMMLEYLMNEFIKYFDLDISDQALERIPINQRKKVDFLRLVKFYYGKVNIELVNQFLELEENHIYKDLIFSQDGIDDIFIRNNILNNLKIIDDIISYKYIIKNKNEMINYLPQFIIRNSNTNKVNLVHQNFNDELRRTIHYNIFVKCETEHGNLIGTACFYDSSISETYSENIQSIKIPVLYFKIVFIILRCFMRIYLIIMNTILK